MIKFKQLMMSAKTIDLKVIDFADAKASKAQMWKDDVLELHCCNIAAEDYAMRTSNYEGAEAIGGFSDFLLPEAAVTQANTFTNTMAKLRNNLRNTPTTRERGAKAGGKGGGGAGAGWVPVEDRVCYECGEIGHLGRDCPKRKARKGGGKGDGEKKEKAEK